VINDKVTLSVEDSGPGIPEEKRRNLYYGRLQESLDASNQGTGMGSNLCRKLILDRSLSFSISA
jgi:two-component system clock-associated histidine kinase SasA